LEHWEQLASFEKEMMGIEKGRYEPEELEMEGQPVRQGLKDS
jgi:hypothetical protein